MTIDEVAFRSLISGQRSGVGSWLLRCLLHAASAPYRLAVFTRNLLYDRRLLRIETVPVPVISIGNLTTGGTGKTPLVALVCERLIAAGQIPGIISRGYRGDSLLGNDEARVLKLLCPTVPHQQNACRMTAATSLLAQHPEVTVLVMDDGFQHRRLSRQLDVVLIDATNPWGHNHLLPRGLLREPVSSLRRAQLIILTRVDQIPADTVASVAQQALRHTAAPVLHAEFRPSTLVDREGNSRPIASLTGQPVFLLSAIGNPEAFAASCRTSGFLIVGRQDLPDHSSPSASEWQDVCRRAQDAGARFVVMTLKDLVKLPPASGLAAFDGTRLTLLALSISAEIPRTADDEILTAALQQVVRRPPVA